MNKKSLLILSVAALLGASEARASSITYSYTAVPSTGSISYGSTNTINLFLQETYAASGGSSLIASDNGLYSGGVAFIYKSGTGATVTAVTPNGQTEPAGFTNPPVDGLATNGGAYIRDTTSNSDTTAGVGYYSTNTVGPTTTRLYFLGSVTMSVTSNANAAFYVESIKNAPASDGISGQGVNNNTLTFGTGYDLDLSATDGTYAVTGGNATVNTFVVSAPEPASFGLILLGGLGVLVRRRRKA